MVAGEEAEMTLTVTSNANVYSPMIEIPISGFSFDNASVITENGHAGTFEVLNSSTGGDQLALFIQSIGWEKNVEMIYQFNITPENHGALDMDLRIRPLYDDTQVTFANETFPVKGRGNVTVSVVDENAAPVAAESIALGANTVADKSSYTFTGILEGTYPLVVNQTGYPVIHTTARVTPGATALYNITLPSSLADPTLVFSEGGAGSIAGVAQVPPEQLNALRNENTTYNVTVLGNGGKIGIALEFPMRYLMNEPVVLVNGDPTEDYKLINGTFTYDVEQQTYSTTNATLIVYNTTAGNNTIEIGFEGGKLGKARSIGEVTTTDALFILQIAIGLERPWDTYDYIDVVDRDSRKITTTDALYVLQQAIGEIRDEYYNVL